MKIFCDLINKAKREIGLVDSLQLESIGLCLSGAENDAIKNELIKEFTDEFSNEKFKVLKVANDLVGPGVACVGKRGTVCVIISGTGSNSGLVCNCELVSTCGGYGYLLEDVAGSFLISNKAFKLISRYYDSYQNARSHLSHENLISEAMKFLGFHDKGSLINAYNCNFSPERIAGFAPKVCLLAEKGDLLSLSILSKLGRRLAKLLLSNLSKSKYLSGNEICVLCVGSVWKSWELLKQSFIEEVKKYHEGKTLKLLGLKVSPALGAALFASSDDFVYNPSPNVEILFQTIL